MHTTENVLGARPRARRNHRLQTIHTRRPMAVLQPEHVNKPCERRHCALTLAQVRAVTVFQTSDPTRQGHAGETARWLSALRAVSG